MSGNFVIYLIGYIVMIVGVAYALNAAGLGQEWIIAAVLILSGLGITAALSRAKRGDVADARVDQSRTETMNPNPNTPPAGTRRTV